MSVVAPARQVALEVLGACRRRGAYARDVLRPTSVAGHLTKHDRALVQRLVLGTTAAVGALDALIDSHVRSGVRLEPRVRDALRMAAYELCWMDTPSAVAVDQGVSLVRGVQPRASGLANAVLRKVAHHDAPARAEALGRVHGALASCAPQTVTSADLTSVSGYPEWVVARVRDERGDAAAVSLALAAADGAPVFVAPNLARVDETNVASILAQQGALPESVGWPMGAFVLASAAPFVSSGLVGDASVVVADLSAQAVAAVVAPSPGARVLEVGQGRGTKTILLQNAALLAGGFAQIVGVDVEAFKTKVAERRMVAAGLSDHVSCLTYDARLLGDDDLPSALAGPFDLVFVDAPCSGTGTLRRHPEIAWSLQPDALVGEGSLPELQLSILRASATRVAVGGLLAYATCSLLRAENEQVVDRFVADCSGATFVREPVSGPFATPEGLLRSNVVSHGHDGHFCACLRRVS